ncbi:ASCH domain-containing protein [Flavobacterium sp. '19STA2R22 D10 B1']|uniref:ASCH domain-containing protein n=1 Tax=Flavobacterium aerium TaxID=3037261 RepID=UPI00278BE460|nr:ASCH domain-containing protein [Flavobacterium sp. '19STA2R22 D10 B1']
MEPYEAFHFGSKEDASEIVNLVKSGIKTTTCSLQWTYEFDNKSLPKPGDQSIVLDGNEQPVCIIETLTVEISTLEQVDQQFAYDGGEGDRSLSEWRKIYKEYISEECLRIGKEPMIGTPLVCERFQVIYLEPIE